MSYLRFWMVSLALLLPGLLPGFAPAQDEPGAGNTPLLVEPKTPEEMFDATVLMTRIGRPNLAKKYLQQFLATSPTDDFLLEIYDKKGPAVFFRLESFDELKPESKTLVDQVTKAFRERNRSPQRVQKLVDALSQSPQERAVAIATLKNAGPVVVPELIKYLDNPRTPQERAQVASAITQLGPQNIPALLGVLDAPEPETRAAVLDILGYIGRKNILPSLWSPAFDPAEPEQVRTAARQAIARIMYGNPAEASRLSSNNVAEELQKVALQHFEQTYAWEPNTDGKVEVWTWIPTDETVGRVELEPKAASLFLGSQLARQAVSLTPNNPQMQALYVALRLAAEREETGWGRPLPTGPGTVYDLALTSGRDVLNNALTLSLERQNAAAATAILQAMAQIGTGHQINKSNPLEAPVVAALNYPDPRVQYAAAMTVLNMDPTEPFASSDRVIQILTRTMTNTGSPRALVIHPNSENGRSLGGYTVAMGYEPVVVTTGREGFRQATIRSDVEVIFVSVNAVQYPLSQVVATLRADARTARIPIVIVGPENTRGNVEYILKTERYQPVTFAREAYTEDVFSAQVKPFLAGLKSPPPSPEQQKYQAQSAAYWMAKIANGQRTKIYNLAPAEQALFDQVGDPENRDNALIALSSIPTGSAQKKLFDIALSLTRTPEEREFSALQLAAHIQRHGLFLSKEDLVNLKQMRESTQEPRLHTALTAVVGSLQPDPEKVQQRISEFPKPKLPVAPVP